MANGEGIMYTAKELLEKIDRSVDEVKTTVASIDARLTDEVGKLKSQVDVQAAELRFIKDEGKKRDDAISSLRNTFIGLAVSVTMAAVVFAFSILAATGRL